MCPRGRGAGASAFSPARRVAADPLPPAQVVVSDYNDESLINNLSNNIILSLPAPVRSRITAIGHTWGTPPDALLAVSPGGFDLILLADTLWFSSAHDTLLSSLSALLSLSPSARVEIVAGFHSGRETVRAFLRKAAASGFEMEGEWEEVTFDGKKRAWGWDVEAGLEDEEEIGVRNRSVVEGRLRRRVATGPA